MQNGSNAEKGEKKTGDEGEGKEYEFRAEVSKDEKKGDEGEPDGGGEEVYVKNESEDGAGNNTYGHSHEKIGLVNGASEARGGNHAKKVAQIAGFFNPHPLA